MELTQLKYFQAVARHEHFTKAADELHVSQPSLSRSISNLEKELGLPLFDRCNHSVFLNSYGQAFLRRVDHILAEMDDARTELRDMKDGVTGSLSVATSFQMDYPDTLTNFIRDFYIAHPKVQMRVFYQSVPEMEQLLRSRRLDFALANATFNAPDIEERRLFFFRLGVIVNRHDPIALRKSVWLRELEDYHFLSNNSSPDLKDTIYEICRRAGFEPKISFECDNSQLVGEAASRGRGILFSSEARFRYNQENDKKNGRDWSRELCFVPVKDELCYRATHIAYLRGRYQTAAARLFLEEMLQTLVPDAEM